MSDEFKIPYASELGTEKEFDTEEEKGLGDYAREALHNSAYSSIQMPISGVAQLLDGATGLNTQKATSFIEAPESQEAYSTGWHVQHVSSAVGMVLPFMLARKGARNLLKGNANRALATRGADVTRIWQSNAVKEAALSGFIYEAAFTPSEHDGNLLASRFMQGVTGAATFGSLAKFSIGARSLGNNLAKTTPVGKLLDNTVASTTLAGLPAGAISAQSHSLLFEGKTASLSSTAESAYSMAFVGMALSAAHKVPVTEKLAAPEPLIKRNNPSPLSGILRGKDGQLSPIGRKLQTARETVSAKANEAATNLDVFLNDLATMGNPHGQLQMAMATPGRNALPMRMESLGTHEGGGRVPPIESTTRSGKKVARVEETVDRKSPESRERKVELAEANSVKAPELLRHHNLGEIADYVQSKKSLRDIVVDPEKVFFGNDALIVMEIKPSAKYPDGAVMKAIVPEGGWETNWGKRPGDAKILGKVHEVDMASTGTSYLYIQELVQVRERYDTRLLDEYFRGIEKEGLAFEEPGNNPNKQFGISPETGKLVLIDYPSTGKPGHMQTLTELIQGPEYYERVYERENTQRRNNSEPSEAEQIANSDGFRRESARQEAKEKRQLDETQRDILEQLTSGVKPREVAEYLAITRGHFTKDGQIDVAKVQPEIDTMVRIAKEEGLSID